MKLYVIRHGQSEGNIRGVFSGWLQHNLTEKGREDARTAGRIIEKVKFDKVYASDLNRAIETAKIAIPYCDCEPTSLIRETNVGIIGNMPYEEAALKYGHLYKKPNGFDYGEIGGESCAQLDKRVQEFLDIVASSQHENIAAFCHGGTMRAFLRNVIGKDINTYNFECPNCCISVFELKNDRWILKTWNYSEEI